jgi:hypothetical protein
MRVLRGAAQTLRLDRPVLLMELFDAALRGQGSSAEEVLDFLRDLGFRVFEFDPVSGKPAPTLGHTPRSSNIIACHPEEHRILVELWSPHLGGAASRWSDAGLWEQTRQLRGVRDTGLSRSSRDTR